MRDARPSGVGETPRDLNVERSRHPRGSLARHGDPTSAPQPGVVVAGAPAAHAMRFREVLDTPDLLEFHPRAALRLIYLGRLTQAQAARQLAISPAQLAKHVPRGLQSVAELLTGWERTPQAERDAPRAWGGG